LKTANQSASILPCDGSIYFNYSTMRIILNATSALTYATITCVIR